jgi:hypothetical protein
MKHLLKFIASRADIDLYQRLLTYSILENAFRQIYAAPLFETKESLWNDCIERQVGERANITFVEFGVYEGYSINYFADKNTNKDSTFIGLDSFEGLPEHWGTMPKGTFDKRGTAPETNDCRVSFIKGWFQDTWCELFGRLSDADKLVVHYDADLYSSTLFALSKIDTLKKNYIAIFDEFTGHEVRALYDYLQAYNASVSFIGRTVDERQYPGRVMCRIMPRGVTSPGESRA